MRHNSTDFWTWISNSLVRTVSLTEPGWLMRGEGVEYLGDLGDKLGLLRLHDLHAANDTNKAVCKHTNINGNKLCSLT